MKNIKLLIVFVVTMYFQSTSTSFINDENYQSNCQNLQDALTLAIGMRQTGQADVLTVVPMQLPFSQKQLVTCRKNYEQQHPGIFQEYPAIIFGTNDGIIKIRVINRQEAEELKKDISNGFKNNN